VRATLVVHEHKRLGPGIELATLAEELKASDVCSVRTAGCCNRGPRLVPARGGSG
jgi:hypothetical protein